MPGVRKVKAGWWNAFRPWTLHGAIVPVLIGGVVAYCGKPFDLIGWTMFLLILAGGILLQSACNLLNTYGDYAKGTDTVENETRSPELVTGVLKPKHVLLAGFACLGITCLIGLAFIWHVGWGILIYGLLGLAGAGMYTVGPAYKYYGLGQPSVFLMMGILMPLGTYYVLTGEIFSWEVLLLSLPNAFLITSVLTGNETRDYHEDRKAGVGTLCGHMSYERALDLYRIMCGIAFPVLLVLLITGAAPPGCALAALSLWDLRTAWDNSRKAPEDPHASFMLVPLAFKLNWHFGVLLAAGYLLSEYIPTVI